MRPTVSVVIPAYNAATWIQETLESVFQQTHAHTDIEVLVVDDASQDGTPEVARSVMRDRAISGKVIERAQNAGVSAARNIGWKLARGEWLQFLDADDLLAPHKIEQQLKVAQRAPAEIAVVYSNWQELRLANGEWQRAWPVHEPFVDDSPIVRILQDQHFGYVGPTLIRRSSLAQIGGFDEECSLAEDLDCMLRLAMAGHSFSRAATDKVDFLYRQTPESLWKHAVTDVETMRALLRVYKRAEQFLRSNDAEGRLTDDARLALARRYSQWAPFFLEYDPESFRDIAQRIASFGVNPAPDANRKLRLLSKLLGWENALRFRSFYWRATTPLLQTHGQRLLCD